MNHLGRCAEIPLQRINLLGVRYAHEKRTYQLCCGCGDIMVPSQDGSHCRFSPASGGMLCCACSDQLDEADSGGEDLPPSFLASLHRPCVICSTPTVSDKHTYLYPHGLCLCLRHHRKALVWRIARAPPEALATRESTYAFIQHAVLARKQARKERAQPSANRAMKRSKQRRNMKR